MPRKVDPRPGEDGYEKGCLPVILTDAEAVVLAGMLKGGPEPPHADDVRSAVADIGNTYRRWNDRGAGAFSRAEARKALEDLLVAGRFDYAALTALNERALQNVHDSLLMTNPAPVRPDDSVTVALMEGRIDEAALRLAVLDAVARLKSRKGPDREGELAWAVAELCGLYEKVTDQRATHSSKGEHLAYQQEPRSEAGGFVRQCFRSIDDQVPAVKISRAMRHFIEGRK